MARVSFDEPVRWAWLQSTQGSRDRQPYELSFNQSYVDLWTREELGRRNYDDLSQVWINLIPFIYMLHWEMALT